MTPRMLAIVLVTTAACGRAPASEKPAPAATVDKKISEGDLVKVTLTPEAEIRLGVALALVEQKAMPRHRLVGGEVAVPSGGSLALAAPVAATVSRNTKLASVGSTVKQGDPLVTLIPFAPVDRDLRAQAERQVTAAEARYTAAKSRLERADTLLKDGAGTPKSVEEARADHDVAKADLDAAKGRLASLVATPFGADVTLIIRAPHDGMVQRLGVSPGQSVAAGTMLVEVVGTSALWVRVPIFVADARRVRLDSPARIAAFGGHPSHDALPAHAPPLADPLTATVDLTYELSGAHDFRPGERVQVALTYLGEAMSLVVPVSAIVHDAHGGAWVYESLGAHVFARRRVDTLGVEGTSAIVARGLRAGTSIVTVGAAELWGVELGAGK